jgi:hypothetical protein
MTDSALPGAGLNRAKALSVSEAIERIDAQYAALKDEITQAIESELGRDVTVELIAENEKLRNLLVEILVYVRQIYWREVYMGSKVHKGEIILEPESHQRLLAVTDAIRWTLAALEAGA